MRRKLLILFSLFVLVSIDCFSQDVYYRCTGNNVNVRRGPGTNYGKMNSSGGMKCPMGAIQLFKGDIVLGYNISRNGFIKICNILPHPCMEDEGWVSAQYLVRATRCSSCRGTGNTGRVCPECGGEGFGYCCNYTGKELCDKCGGIGFY